MEPQIIKSETAYGELLDWVDGQFDLHHPPESKEGEKLQIALLLIKQYEDAHYPAPLPDLDC
jgi:HTH-type transcriptional regulator/antitoxin HigA